MDDTRRWRLDIAYDGANFSGWARQPGLRTVQGELEHWVPKVLRLDRPVELTVAGRTDAGVHARGQVAHLDLPGRVDPRPDLVRRLDRVLDPDLVVAGVHEVPDDFDARFSALWRRYVYRLWDADSRPDPLVRHHVAQVRDRLDVELLNRAAEQVKGMHDFAAFCKAREGATTIRDLLECRAVRRDDPSHTVEVTVRADAFCHSMVRSLVGALTAVAAGRRGLDWLAGLLRTDHRDSSVLVMPAAGLTLEEVGYPARAELAARAHQARSRRGPADLEGAERHDRRDQHRDHDDNRGHDDNRDHDEHHEEGR